MFKPGEGAGEIRAGESVGEVKSNVGEGGEGVKEAFV